MRAMIALPLSVGLSLGASGVGAADSDVSTWRWHEANIFRVQASGGVDTSQSVRPWELPDRGSKSLLPPAQCGTKPFCGSKLGTEHTGE